MVNFFTAAGRRGFVCRAAAAVASGLAATLGFAPTGLWFVTAAAAALVFYVIEKSDSVKEAALLGWLWGVACFACGLSWTHRAMAVYGGVGDTLAAGGVLVMAAVLALTYAVPAAIARSLRFSSGAAAALLLPAGWVLAEVVRTDGLGFGWLTTGYAFDTTILAAWAPAGGVHAVALAGLFIAGAAAASAARMENVYLKTAAAIAAGGAALGAVALEPVTWSQPGSRMDVRLVQPDLPVALSMTLGNQMERLERVEAMSLASPLGSRLDLIVWPESVYAAPLGRLPASMALLPQRVAQKMEADVVFNAFNEPAPRQFFNSLWLAGADGSFAPVYAKRHLVPFGEFVPFGFRWFVEALGIPMADQQRGAIPAAPVRAAGQPLVAAVCYENNFADEMRGWWRLPETPAYLVTVANLGWFGEKAAHQFTQISAMRSREAARPQLQAVNNGYSAVIDATGRVERLASPGAQNLDAVFVTARGEATPYVRWGDAPVGGVALLVLLLAAGLRFRPRRP